MNIIERAKQLRKIIERLSGYLDDTDALDNTELFSVWEPDVEYETGTRVRYNETLYKCLQKHTSQESWDPESAPSLWAKVLIPDPDIVPEWVQPDSTNPYMKGDKVMHNGSTWICTIDNNVWEPGVYGWEMI